MMTFQATRVIRLTDIEQALNTYEDPYHQDHPIDFLAVWQVYLNGRTLIPLEDGTEGVPEQMLTLFLDHFVIECEIR